MGGFWETLRDKNTPSPPNQKRNTSTVVITYQPQRDDEHLVDVSLRRLLLQAVILTLTQRIVLLQELPSNHQQKTTVWRGSSTSSQKNLRIRAFNGKTLAKRVPLRIPTGAAAVHSSHKVIWATFATPTICRHRKKNRI